MQLYNDDCLNVLKNISDKSIDLVVIDPPYLFSGHGGGGIFGNRNRQYHNELEEKELVKGYDEKILKELLKKMKKINIYIWCNKKQIYNYLSFFKEHPFEIITWHKTNPIPTCSNKYLSDTEYLLFFREKGVLVNGTYNTKKKYYISQTNKLDKERFGHPTIKPLDITKNLIINSSNEGDIVLDCFMGSGTTGVACKQLNRKFIGIEIDKGYFNIAKRRIENFEKEIEYENLTLWG